VAIGKRFYWPKMKQDVEHFVRTYVKCQNTKSIYKKKYELYRPLPILNKPWESVSMDFMTQLSEWDGRHSYCDLSLGLVTKAKGLQRCGPRLNLRVAFSCSESAKE